MSYTDRHWSKKLDLFANRETPHSRHWGVFFSLKKLYTEIPSVMNGQLVGIEVAILFVTAISSYEQTNYGVHTAKLNDHRNWLVYRITPDNLRRGLG